MTPCKAFGHTEGRNKQGKCAACQRAAKARYEASPGGKAQRATYEASPEGKALTRARKTKWYAAHSGLTKARADAHRTAHPLRHMLYAARQAVKKTKLRLETME